MMVFLGVKIIAHPRRISYHTVGSIGILLVISSSGRRVLSWSPLHLTFKSSTSSSSVFALSAFSLLDFIASSLVCPTIVFMLSSSIPCALCVCLFVCVFVCVFMCGRVCLYVCLCVVVCAITVLYGLGVMVFYVSWFQWGCFWCSFVLLIEIST